MRVDSVGKGLMEWIMMGLSGNGVVAVVVHIAIFQQQCTSVLCFDSFDHFLIRTDQHSHHTCGYHLGC